MDDSISDSSIEDAGRDEGPNLESGVLYVEQVNLFILANLNTMTHER